jgi:hypothetical protein
MYFNIVRKYLRFKEKYHPVFSKPLSDQILARKRDLFPNYLTELTAGTFNEISFDASPISLELPEIATAKETGATGDLNNGVGDKTEEDAGVENGHANVSSSGHIPEPPKVFALFLKTVPSTVKRQELIDVSLSSIYISVPKLIYHYLFRVFRRAKK